VGQILQRHLGDRGGLLPGQYCTEPDYDGDGLRVTHLCCSQCGGIERLGGGHVVDRQGRVTPSWKCPTATCSFWEWLELESWGVARGANGWPPLTAIIVLLAAIGCVHAARTPLRDLTVQQQQHQAVFLEVFCDGFDENSGPTYWASGGIISSRHVLTARHVIDKCPGAIPIVRAHIPGDRQPYRMVWQRWLRGDAVLLQRTDAGGWDWALRPRAAMVRIGDVVCAEPAFPARRRQCGAVSERYEHDTARGGPYVRYELDTTNGNSGALVYDRQGHLVGIHSARQPNTPHSFMAPVDWRTLP
jgi:hypothetical protein